jgi:hypothetical protein
MQVIKTGLGKRLAVSSLALAIGAGFVPLGDYAPIGLGVAYAQSQGNQGDQGQGGQAGQGNQGGQGQGQGGPSSDSDGKGPQAGAPSDNMGGGKPAWAQEGLPEVELGRLSVARSPDKVLDRALAEALATFTPEMAEFYELSVAEMIEELSLNWDSISIYDSPLQNLALMKDILVDGETQLDVDNSNDTLMAVFLAVASDKTIPISTNTVIAVTTIFGYPITGDAAADLAATAEDLRIAVLAGHG